MSDHFHTSSSQPKDIRAHLAEHGLELDEHPGRGTRMSSGRQLQVMHSRYHPDHEILTPSCYLVRKEAPSAQLLSRLARNLNSALHPTKKEKSS